MLGNNLKNAANKFQKLLELGNCATLLKNSTYILLTPTLQNAQELAIVKKDILQKF